MSTLPPPTPGQPLPPEPMTSTTAAPALSQGQRIINTFIAPSKTFTDIQKNSSWWVPWLIGSIIGLMFAVVAVQKLDMKRFIQQQIEQSPSAQKRMEQVPEGQREQALSIQATVTKVVFYLAPLFGLVFGLLCALVLWVIFGFGFGGDIGFGRSLAVVFYAFLPRSIYAILLTVSFLASSDPNTIDIANNPMPLNPAFFMDPTGNKFLYVLAGGFDVINIWIVALMGLGFAKASVNKKPSTSAALTTMFVVYALLILASAAFKSAFA
jgi:hypothetical protein